MLTRQEEHNAFNAIDASMAYASNKCAEILNMLAQNKERGYRAVLLPLYEAHKCSNQYKPDIVLNSVVKSISLVCAATKNRLDDVRLSDLALFFIKRAENLK